MSEHDSKSIELLNRTETVGWPRNEKRQQRYYLLPGMGGRAARRKHHRILRWAIIVGILAAAALGTALYFVNGLIQ